MVISLVEYRKEREQQRLKNPKDGPDLRIEQKVNDALLGLDPEQRILVDRSFGISSGLPVEPRDLSFNPRNTEALAESLRALRKPATSLSAQQGSGTFSNQARLRLIK